jgi:hypothetical protein
MAGEGVVAVAFSVLVVGDRVAFLAVSLEVVVAEGLCHLLRSRRCRVAVEEGDAVEGVMAVLVEGCQTSQSQVEVRHLRQRPPQLLSRVSRHRGRPAAPRNLLGVLSCPRSPCRKS